MSNSSLNTIETGLRGVLVGYCPTSFLDPNEGLRYRDIELKSLSSYSCEEVIYLLYYGNLPSQQELRLFQQQLFERAVLTPETVRALHQLPREGDPMALLSCAILLLGMFEKQGDYKEDGLNLIAKVPLLGAHVINHHRNAPCHIPSDPSYLHRFAIPIVGTSSQEALEVMRLFDLLHYDHGGGNLSTFVGKSVASGLADQYASIASAVNALAGPRHGKANQQAFLLLRDLVQQLGENPSSEQVRVILEQRLAEKGLIYGFGHAVLRIEDPRATLFYEYGERHYPEDPYIRMALVLRDIVPPLLQQRKAHCPYANVDAISGALLHAAGIQDPAYYTTLFAISRIVGIVMQIIYERCEAREGKGTPIMRPSYLYLGARNKTTGCSG